MSREAALRERKMITLESENGIYSLWKEGEYFCLKLIEIKNYSSKFLDIEVLKVKLRHLDGSIEQYELSVGDKVQLKFKNYRTIEQVLNDLKESGFEKVK